MAKSNEKPKPSAKAGGVLPWDATENPDDGRPTVVAKTPNVRDLSPEPAVTDTSETAVAFLPEDGPSTFRANAESFRDLEEAPPAPPRPPPLPQVQALRKPTRGEMNTDATEPLPVRRSIPEQHAAEPAPSKPTRGEAPQAAGRKPTRAEIASAPTAPLPLKKRHTPPPPEQKEAESEEEGSRNALENTGSHRRKVDPGARWRLFVVIAVSLLVIGGVGVFGAVTFLSGERPDVAELQLAYPYGFEGKHGPRGEQAPGAAAVAFKHLTRVPCSSHQVCIKYQYSAGAFVGTMVVGKANDGTWVRVGDEGTPFVPVVDEP